ncbi:MAG: DUF1700 domain-containing protein [Coriobacteriales bacterium]|jgi:uncharacterized membrane protein|nr:DUF1700 domain-containing protein [Coriobacteriales bacterium]
MTAAEYLYELRKRLRKLPPQEIDQAMSYYEEYFAEAGPGGEAELINRLGSPVQVASAIISDYAMKDIGSTRSASSAGSSGATGSTSSPGTIGAAGGTGVVGGTSGPGTVGGTSSAGSAGSAYPPPQATPALPPPQAKQGSPLRTMWIVILAVFAIPIGIPVAIALIVVLFSVLVALFSVFLAFFVSALSLAVAGLGLAGIGVVALFAQPIGAIAMLGAALICISLGLALGVGTVKLCQLTIKAITWIFARILGRKGGHQ